MKPIRRTLTAALMLAGAVTAAQAADGIEIHGFANQNFLRSRDLPYKDATSLRDSWDETTVALLFTAPLDERTKAWAQLHGTQDHLRLDWAFVDYRFNASTIGRAGRIKLPVGLYNDIIDARFLQLSTEVPFLYQEVLGIVPESFNGVGVNTEHAIGGASISVDLYAGQTPRDEEEPTVASSSLTGARATVHTPISGLRLMASAYRNKLVDSTDPAAPLRRSLKTWVLSADYKDERFDLKTEVASSRLGDTRRQTWYVQGGYTLAEKWQPYLRLDRLKTDADLAADPAFYQRDTVVGLNYFVNSSVSLRAEKHLNRGYALPVAGETVAAGDGRAKWSFVTASVNFIF